MSVYNWIVVISWIVFIAIWIVAAFGAKKARARSWTSFAVRFAIAVIIVILLHFSIVDRLWADSSTGLVQSACPLFGVVFVVAGVAFALWARFYLGRNWGMPMTLKESPELVTSGPYAYVRHPIYSGFFAAMLGSALASSWFWLLFLVFFGAYFIYSASVEEKIMTKQFPDSYPAYKARSKMLIPFVY